MTGPRNLITDVPGLKVGNASDQELKSGATVLVPDEPAVASVAIHGGAPGTREIALLEPEQTVEKIDAVVLAGGSAFGLDAGAGVQGRLAELGYGFEVGPVRVPIVPTAILFDLLNGGDKSWGQAAPYRDLGRSALDAISRDFALGSVGAGTGATTANLKGGLGSASQVLDNGVTVGAIVAVNALGRATIGDTEHFWAAPFEVGEEFGARGLAHPFPADGTSVRTKLDALKAGANTTIAAVATDAVLTKGEAKRLAVMAHDGLARAFGRHTRPSTAIWSSPFRQVRKNPKTVSTTWFSWEQQQRPALHGQLRVAFIMQRLQTAIRFPPGRSVSEPERQRLNRLALHHAR